MHHLDWTKMNSLGDLGTCRSIDFFVNCANSGKQMFSFGVERNSFFCDKDIFPSKRSLVQITDIKIRESDQILMESANIWQQK